MIDRVWIEENLATRGHWLIITGREYPGAPRGWLRADGTWETIKEANQYTADPEIGFRMPEGALDAIVAEYAKVATPHPATERHLLDAIAIRDRLLVIVEEMK